MPTGSTRAPTPSSLKSSTNGGSPNPQPDVTLEAIRKLVSEASAAPPVDADPAQTEVQKADPAPLSKAPATHTAQGGRRWLKRGAASVSRLMALFLHRPDAPRILAILLLVTFVLLKPWVFVSLFAAILVTLAVVYLSVGPDRLRRLVLAWFHRLQRRNPERADAVRQRAARIGARVSSLLERLPETWTFGLYVPDFEQPPQNAPDPFDRLAAQVSEAKNR